MPRPKSKPVVELGAFVQHPDDPSVTGRVMAAWDDDEGVRRVRATWPALRIESDHKASDMTAVERPKPKAKPVAATLENGGIVEDFGPDAADPKPE